MFFKKLLSYGCGRLFVLSFFFSCHLFAFSFGRFRMVDTVIIIKYCLVCLVLWWNCILFFKNFNFNYFFNILYHFDILMLKINFKKYYFNIFKEKIL
jgi:hypothetical protein